MSVKSRVNLNSSFEVDIDYIYHQKVKFISIYKFISHFLYVYFYLKYKSKHVKCSPYFYCTEKI